MSDRDIENPMVMNLHRHVRRCRPEQLIRQEPACCCGCRREVVDGWEWDGDFFFDDGCVVRYLKNTNTIKPFELF